jgi:hypothetical protein
MLRVVVEIIVRFTQRFPPCSDVPSYSGVTTTSDIIPREHENINHGSWGQLSRERSHNMSSPGIALTVFFGLLSLVLSLILYSRAGRRKRLTFTYDLAQLHTRTHPEITIMFKGKQIENLSRLRVVLWNSGNQEIRRSDLPSGGNPEIVLNGARVLSVALTESSAETKCRASERGDNATSIDFEFLNPNDYATVDVLFETTGAKHASVQFVSRVIGGLQSESRTFQQPLWAEWITPLTLTLLWCIGACYWGRAIPNWAHTIPRGIAVQPGAVWASVLLLVGLLGCIAVIREYLRRRHNSRLPVPARHAFSP